ncbi:MAG: hypothetical protein FWE80_06780 [Oscillospiraceae bacterium]|nr:hypothetical protein [Oscillospiraceae bacterium]
MANNTEPAAVPKFTKDQLLGSKRYTGRRDLLGVLLDGGKSYTRDEVDEIIKKFMEGKVK